MTLVEILAKLQLGLKYKQNCTLGFMDCATLLAHINDLNNTIETLNDTTSVLNTYIASIKPKKGKK